MKKYLFFFVNLTFVLALSAQKPSLTKAYNAFYDKEYEKAKTQIDLCANDEKLSAKAQTWLYKGNIDLLIANQEYNDKQKNDSYVIKYPDAPVTAFDAFEKALSINPKIEALDMMSAQDGLKQLYPYLLVRGVDQIIAKDLQNAKSTLEKGIKSYEIDKPQIPLNGELYYYYAYVLENLGDTLGMMKFYQKSIDDGSQNPYVYSKVIDFYKNRNDKDNAEKTLRTARRIAPNDLGIRMLDIDFAYWTGDSAKAKSMLDKIDANSLTKVDEMVNVANFYIKDKNYEEADRLLARAYRIDPDNFVILYNLGVCNYNLSEIFFNKQNRLAVENGSKQEIENAKSLCENYLKKSSEYFEKANKIQPNDLNLLKTLRSIYVRQQSSKYDEIDALIKKIEQ